MRLLLEIVIIAAVVHFGWETPWNQRVPWLASFQSTKSSGSPGAAHGNRAGSGVKPAPLADQPLYNKDRSFTGHIYYVDAAGKKYWLDAQGHRHYEP